MKREESTFIRGPFWTSLLRSHNIALNDVVTFTLINQDGEEGADQEGENEEEEEEEENPVDRAEHVFSVVARDPTGRVKEFQNKLGMFSSWHILIPAYFIVHFVMLIALHRNGDP